MNIGRIIFNFLRFDRANWKAVILCVLAAMVFWIFNAFNKNYSANVSFPILFEFDGEKYTLAEHLPKTIDVNVSGNGWDLFRKHLGFKTPRVIIPLDKPYETKKIVASSLTPVLASQIGSLKINFVVTDTMRVHIDKRDSHRYKLMANVSVINFREGYGRISPVVVLPDSVKLEGPESLLHKLIDPINLTVDGENVSENFREEVEIGFEGSEFVKRDPPVAQVMFEVGEVKRVNKKLRVRLDKNSNLKISDSVTVQFQIPTNRAVDFETQSKEILCEVNSIFVTKNKVAFPKFLNVPSYSLILKTDSVYLK